MFCTQLPGDNNMLNDGLREILAKQPVVNTKIAEQLLSEPQEVEHAYLEHYHTHVPLGDTDNFVKRLVERTRQRKTSKGAVVAPWGYGKTSTLIFSWKACEDQNLIAVPPFVCASWQDILTATYGWLRFRLGGDLVEDLESRYNHFNSTTFEEHVKTLATSVGVSETDARAILQEEKKRGTPIGELTPASLLQFLEYASQMVTQHSGFDGLVILADELTQIIDSSTNLQATIQQLREIVLWLATHDNLPLSLILCMPDTTEGAIQEPGNDVLDRIKSDRLYINLRDIYSATFPIELWDRYADRFELGDVADKVIHPHTLRSIGQIATREDLGRGPRTVVDALQCAIRHFDHTGEIYTPVDLIDDFMNGQMSFDTGQTSNSGQVHTIRSAVEDVLALGNLIRTPEHREAVKLWAAFPEHGCPDEVLQEFGVSQKSADEISHYGHGELLTYQTSGYTLRKLASFTPGGDIVERIARDFWRAYRDEDQQWIESAQRGFMNGVLPQIFDTKKWGKLEEALQPTPLRGYRARLEGTFSDLYPNRMVDLQIGIGIERIEKRISNSISDIQMDFVLTRKDDTSTGSIELVNDNFNWLRYQLNLTNKSLAGDQLPRDLLNLKASIHPRRLTPQLMLSFVDYCDQWEDQGDSNRISPGESGKVEAIKTSMINYAVRLLFSDDLRATVPFRVQASGLAIIRELFTSSMKSLYPRYVSLLIAGEQSLKDYIGTLDHLSLKEKRGQRCITEQRKSQIAALFSTSWSTLSNRANSGYATLMKIDEIRGDEAQLTLLLHPMEVRTLNEFDEKKILIKIDGNEFPALPAQDFLDICTQEGYRDVEAAWILKLLAARELIQVDKTANSIYRVPSGPPVTQVKQQLDDIWTAIQQLPSGFILEKEKNALLTSLASIKEQISPELDDETLEELALDIERIKKKYEELLQQKKSTMDVDLENLVNNIDEGRRKIDHAADLDDEIGPGLDFRRTLLDMQRELKKERERLRSEISRLRTNVVANQQKLCSDGLIMQQIFQSTESAKETSSKLSKRCDALYRNYQGYIEWLKLLRETDELYKSLATLPELRVKLVDDIVHRINQNFARRKFDALAEDYEQFRKECTEIISQRESWVATKREEFNKRKELLRSWLKNLRIERPDFPARYDHLEHEKSYEEMYAQVSGIAQQQSDNLRRQIDEIRLDVRRARQIQWAKLEAEQKDVLKKIEKRQTQLEGRRDDIQQDLENFDFIEVTEEILTSLSAQVSTMVDDLQDMKIELQQFLKPLPPKTDDEKAVLDLLRGQREMDLTDLVLKTEHDVEQVMDGLIGLYQGNQVVIKVTKRG
jgi:hypothetical protein